MDHLQDRSHSVLYRLSKSTGFPSFVKEASLMSPQEARQLPSSSFADQSRRLFPIHTRADTWLSLLYFHKAGFDLDTLLGTSGRQMLCNILDKAARLWQLEDERNKLTAPVIEKTASAPLTIVYKVKDEVVGSIEVRGPDQLRKVASDLCANRKLYPYYTRKAVAEQLLDGERLFGKTFTVAELQTLQKQAGRACGLVEDVLACVAQRWRNCRDTHPEWTPALLGMQKSAKQEARSDLVGPDTLIPIAAALDAIDRASGLTLKYASRYSFPEDVLFRWSLQDMQDFQKNAAVLPGNTIVGKSFLKEAKTAQQASELFGYDPEKDSTVEVWLRGKNPVDVSRIVGALLPPEPIL